MYENILEGTVRKENKHKITVLFLIKNYHNLYKKDLLSLFKYGKWDDNRDDKYTLILVLTEHHSRQSQTVEVLKSVKCMISRTKMVKKILQLLIAAVS